MLLAAPALAVGLFALAAAAMGERMTPVIPTAWLQEKTTIVAAEAAHPGITDGRVARDPDAAKPFGFSHRQWQDFKAAIAPGDELWTFSSPPKSWEDLAGRAGIALVRKGVPIKIIITMMN